MSSIQEPTDLEFELAQRHGMFGQAFIGPLTRDQQDAEDRYEAWYEDQEREYALEQKHGGKQRCPECDTFAVKMSVVSTGYDNSTLRKCEACGWEDFAG